MMDSENKTFEGKTKEELDRAEAAIVQANDAVERKCHEANDAVLKNCNAAKEAVGKNLDGNNAAAEKKSACDARKAAAIKKKHDKLDEKAGGKENGSWISEKYEATKRMIGLGST